MSSPSSLEKRRLKDRKRNFNPQWEQDFAFINHEGRPLCLLCNTSLTHFKSCNLKRHYETHHKKFAADYPPWSEIRRNKLLALKLTHTKQRADVATTNRDADSVGEAGRMISQLLRQTDHASPDAEFCKHLISRVASILDPNNTRLQRLITSIPAHDQDIMGLINTYKSESACELSGSPDNVSIQTSDYMTRLRTNALYRLLTRNIRRIEAAAGCFICSACPLTSVGQGLVSGVSYSDPRIFQDHLSKYHHHLPSIVCVYCGWRVPGGGDHFVSHVAQHFLPTYSSEHSTSGGGVYCCPAEPSCSTRFRTDRLPSLEVHWLTQHVADVKVQSRFKCPHCPRTFASLSLWAAHIQHSARPLMHCSAPGCLVKSPSRSLLIDHIHRRHSAETSDQNPVAEMINETLEAVVIYEKLHVKLLDSSSQPLKMNASVTDFVLSSPSVPIGAASNTPVPSENTLVPQYINSFRPSSPENDEFVSPMNLAALARPSASRFMNHNGRIPIQSSPQKPTGQQAHHPATSIQLLSSMQPTSLSMTSWAPNLSAINTTTSTVNSPSISLLHSAAALKTLQELTATGGSDVSKLTASEAASAVAAMAAAALQGLTGFDVSKSTSSTTMLNNIVPSFSGVATSAGQVSTTTSAIAPHALSEAGSSSVNEDCNSEATANHLDEALAEKYLSDAKADGGRTSDDMVSFPFDEAKFRSELYGHVHSEALDSLVTKMHQFSSYFVRILGKENHRRIPVCPECDKVFPYGLGDFKRHLLTVHLEVPREHLKDCLRFTYLPKSEEKFQELQEQLAMRQMKPRLLEGCRRRVPLPYSIVILRRLTRHLPVATREFLEQKMQLYSRLTVIVDTRGGFRRYRCNHCNYSSPHALADVRKHILGSHCGISTKHFRHCLQASRLDPVEFTLFSDEKLARLARDYMHRQHGSEAFIKAGSRSPSPDDTFNQNGLTEADSVASSPSNSGSERRSHDTFVSHVTAVVPGSRNRVTVRIRPPVPPDSVTTRSATQSISNPANGNMCSPTSPPRSSESPDSSTDFMASTTLENLDLNALSSVPGLEGADRIVDLALPFSEPVLRQLLESAGATSAQTEDVVSKMYIYSTYTMTRICRSDRTLAFRCPCGRMFLTTRQRDSKIRAATLADSRRHVMGVHARIQHEFLTICCQASRITREYDFQIYPDDMLLRLAVERPIKLTGSVTPGNNATNRTEPSTIRLRSRDSSSCKQNSSSTRLSDAILAQSDKEDVADVHSASSVDGLGTSREFNDEDEMSVTEDKDPAKRVSTAIENPLSHLRLAQASSSEEVERVIDLPYSSDALHCLVEGYCPPSYFPILEEKMDVYSSLKVFISRRRGRRYFCCSGCSSSSPHGMGDIRKHILGVHAKVPERYKAAAMHCSRLSREDNTLLPKHVLLHLAKMKWKGTVIKPLAEMDLSQFGARRASAVGLVKQTGQFASQVYQPSTQHRDSEKLTALSTTTTVTTGNHRSPSPIKKCDYSAYGDTSSSTLDTGADPVVASDMNSEEKVFLDEQPYVIRMNTDPDRSVVEDGCSLVYACSACPLLSSSMGSVRAHILRAHLDMPPHPCPHCDQVFYTSKRAMSHHEESHPDVEFTAGSDLTIYQKAMSEIPISNIESESSVRIEQLKQRLRTNLGNKRVSEVCDSDSANPFNLDPGDADPTHWTSTASQVMDSEPHSKIPRLDASRPSSRSSHCSNGFTSLMNGVSDQSKPHNSASRLGLIGSSRRKPSKMQLVQLKPSMEPEHTESSEVLEKACTSQAVSSNEVRNKVILDVSEI
ncbi:unnamed protein product [Dicrocoelium dendriticum]|nr:unnamed protein product [Dicrocoelium dendriticum]